MDQEIRDLLNQGLNCAQVILVMQCTKHDWDSEQARAFTLLFSHGMGYGLTCGCVIAAYLALGRFFPKHPGEAKAAKARFDTAFLDEFGALNCDELLRSPELNAEERAAVQKNSFSNALCPVIMEQTCYILNSILKES